MAPAQAESTSKLSPGTIIAIVAVAGLALFLPAGGYLLWRRRRRNSGVRVLDVRRRSSAFGLPSAALRTTPFYINHTSSDSGSSLLSSVAFRGSLTDSSGTNSACKFLVHSCPSLRVLMACLVSPGLSGTHPRVVQEKPAMTRTYPPITRDPFSRGRRSSLWWQTVLTLVQDRRPFNRRHAPRKEKRLCP